MWVGGKGGVGGAWIFVFRFGKMEIGQVVLGIDKILAQEGAEGLDDWVVYENYLGGGGYKISVQVLVQIN